MSQIIYSMKHTIRLNESKLSQLIIESIRNIIGVNGNNNVDKNNQLAVVMNNNPSPDDIHTWIRTKEDIKTYVEALNDSGITEDEDLTPDFGKEDIKLALQTGKITVYSSYPIRLGVFVTPSRMEAQNYAGNGRVYVKVVKLSDVAWIDPLQGQYVNSN